MMESPHPFTCAGEDLIAIYHSPNSDGLCAGLGVVMVAGGAQYRVGSHRLYVQLARGLSAAGCAVMRFDSRGLGDSSGEWRGFEHIASDIADACRQLMKINRELRGVVLWGLCDGATAALLSADLVPALSGMILVNPWLENQQAQARTMLRHYYRRRLLSADLWRKVLTGAFSPAASWRSFMTFWRQRKRQDNQQASDTASRLIRAMTTWSSRLSIVIAEKDLTAQAYLDWFSSKNQSNRELSSIRIDTVVNADHTFSYRDKREQLLQISLQALARLDRAAQASESRDFD